ncbi:MAG TPA: amino acid ABC transporter permease [Acidimicrobiales bacterium]|nr:amino acid ABC transporter permease [Acidimicrobiales bacterium]
MEPVVEIPGTGPTVEPLPVPSPVPTGRPEVHLTPRQWMRQNLFATPWGSVLSVVFGLVLAYGAYRLAWFVAVSSDWQIIRSNLRLFMIGRFPSDEVSRLWGALYIVAALAGLLSGAIVAKAEEEARAAGRAVARPGRWDWLRRYWPALGALAVILSQTRTWTPTLLTLVGIAILLVTRRLGRGAAWLARFAWLVLLAGVVAVNELITGFGGVGWGDWGGLLLTVFVTVAGIALSFPLGVLVALGRRSSLPALRGMTVTYIELIRGVPLVALLFMGHYVVPLLYPNTVDPPSALARALIAVTLFESAYIAETVRGGLQAITRGQYEAAQALGLAPWKVTRLIVLPQALRAVIPAMVGQFISLFKDTSLLAILGFLELLEAARITTAQPDFLGQRLHTVTFAFVALIYWAGSYTMSRESRRIEHRLGLGERR